jgi:protein tyrosine phosphatase (PTP) superfamily phosphohydrolase (DUF442 family)
MEGIRNYREVSNLLACAGQPTEEQLKDLALAGFKVVINLGLADGSYALSDEAASVKALDIIYHHIPVVFDAPRLDELREFFVLMDKYATLKVLVHCAANYRATAFVGLYLLSIHKVDETEMEDFMEDVWMPNQIWREFIEEVALLLSKNGKI